MATKVFAKGISTFKPREGAPDFVLGQIIINVNKLNEWFQGEGNQYLTTYKDEPQLKLDVTTAKDGGITIAVNTYKKESN